MVRYETLLLMVPEITADEIKNIEAQMSKTVADKKGTLISFERWGKYRLAYPVKKNDYGVYFLARFEAEQPDPLVPEIKNLLDVRLHNLIMRSMISRLDLKKSLEYQRPQSLEEAPSRDGGFFKDSGMGRSDRHSDHEDVDTDEDEE